MTQALEGILSLIHFTHSLLCLSHLIYSFSSLSPCPSHLGAVICPFILHLHYAFEFGHRRGRQVCCLPFFGIAVRCQAGQTFAISGHSGRLSVGAVMWWGVSSCRQCSPSPHYPTTTPPSPFEPYRLPSPQAIRLCLSSAPVHISKLHPFPTIPFSFLLVVIIFFCTLTFDR